MKKFTLALVVILLTGSITLSAQNVVRNVVVIEIATGTWCTYCPGAAKGVDQLVAEGKKVAVIENHDGDAYSNAYSDARNNYYNPSGVPTAWFDGMNASVGGYSCSSGGSCYSGYLTKYNTRIAVTSPVSLCMSGRNISGNDYQVTVSATKVGTITASDLRLHLALTESHISQSWQGCMTELNFVNRLMAPDANGSAISFTSGNTQTVNLSFTRNSAWVLDNLELVAFLQNYTTKEIYNAVIVKLTDLPTDPINAFNINADHTSGCDPLAVNLSCTASGITDYSWTLPGASSTTSTLANPSVIYSTPGSYDVSVNVSNGACSRTETRTNFITVNSSPAAYNITGGGYYCAQGGTGVNVGLDGSQNGIQYTLYYNGAPVDTRYGNGAPISFGLQLDQGTYTVTALNSGNGCTKEMNGPVTVGVDPQEPLVAADPTGPSVVYITSTPTSQFTTTGATYAHSYSWELSPEYVGTIQGNGATCTVVWDPLYPRSATIKVKGVNSCGEGVYSNEVPVDVYLGVGMNDPQEARPVRLIPNPASDVVTIIPAQSMTADITVINSVGKQELSISKAFLGSGYKLNISKLMPGIYYVRVSNSDINQSLKLVVR